MNNVINKSGYLRVSRSFPNDINELSFEVNKAYVEIAQSVNNKVIGFFTENRATVTGENWVFNQSKKQQGLRQIYQWDDTHLTITHGINFFSLTNFVRIWGTFFDGTSWQTLPYVDTVNATNQIKVSVNSTTIVITKGAGAPTCTNGLVILEWIANP